MLAELRDYLAADAEIHALVGGRIYRDRARQDAGFPRILLSRGSSSPVATIDADAPLAETFVLVACWDRDPQGAATAAEVATAVRDRLSGFRGLWGDLSVHACRLTAERDLSEPPGDGSDNWLCGVAADYRIHHYLASPTLT